MTKHDKNCVKQKIQTIWKRQQIKKKGEANDEDSCCCSAHLMTTRLELSALTFRSHLFVSKGVHRRKKVTAWGEVDVKEPAQYSYPLMTVNDVEEVEKSLKNSEAARKQLCKVLSHIGGTTVRNTTANMLKHLLHDSVGVNYNLYGQKGKKALVSMELFKVIVESVRKNPNTHSASDMDVRSAVMAWLKNCQARLNTTTKRTSSFQVDDAIAILLTPTYTRQLQLSFTFVYIRHLGDSYVLLKARAENGSDGHYFSGIPILPRQCLLKTMQCKPPVQVCCIVDCWGVQDTSISH
ncbi:hypothetical protein V5799_028483 [Amblyomma americanum]|uniref:DUF4806 domain-containing protein n=1 Tax=Amblyomma americanum TaxID=6943 RepID=A0AAQ4DCR0_AMBAM